MEETNSLEIIGGEVYKVLHSIQEEEFYKIPKNITDIFEKYKKNGEQVRIDYNKSFAEQDISKKAKDIIFAISLNYWLTEKERQEVIKKMKQNEEQIKEIYDIENMFKNKKDQDKRLQEDIKEETALITIKENWLKKIINNLKSFLKKLKKI